MRDRDQGDDEGMLRKEAIGIRTGETRDVMGQAVMEAETVNGVDVKMNVMFMKHVEIQRPPPRKRTLPRGCSGSSITLLVQMIHWRKHYKKQRLRKDSVWTSTVWKRRLDPVICWMMNLMDLIYEKLVEAEWMAFTLAFLVVPFRDLDSGDHKVTPGPFVPRKSPTA